MELLVAVALVGVLIAVVTPSLSGARESSRALVCSANARSMAQGVAAYASANKDRMPPSYVGADTDAAAAGKRIRLLITANLALGLLTSAIAGLGRWGG